MTILITGSTGLLGRALSRRLAPFGDVVGISRHAPASPEAGRHVVGDLCDAAGTRALLSTLQPDVVVNTQACSDVDRCEMEPDTARAQNVETVRHLADALTGTHTLLVHLSTDYVFDGAKGAPYDETDVPNPLGVYGRSKLEGERCALRHDRTVVVRTSTLFGPDRMNFCDHLVSRLRAGEPVEAFSDQVTSPTYADDLAAGLAELVAALLQSSETVPPRYCHVANEGGCSRVTFATRVAELLGCPRDLVRPVPMTSQRRPAPRPPYSALTTTQLPQLIGRRLRSWDGALQAYLRDRRWLG